MKDEWQQSAVIHCPDNECSGMLLNNPYYHAFKCSKCGKLWMSITEFKETDELV